MLIVVSVTSAIGGAIAAAAGVFVGYRLGRKAEQIRHLRAELLPDGSVDSPRLADGSVVNYRIAPGSIKSRN